MGAAVGFGVGLGVAGAVGFGVGFGVGLGVGLGVAAAAMVTEPAASVNSPLLRAQVLIVIAWVPAGSLPDQVNGTPLPQLPVSPWIMVFSTPPTNAITRSAREP